MHNIGIDTQDRILICDRESSRIQIFDYEGQFITMWEDVNGPGDVYCSPDQLVYVAEQGGSLGKGPRADRRSRSSTNPASWSAASAGRRPASPCRTASGAIRRETYL